MCGIVGYIGNKEAFPIIINGLKRLEYRGYDSAGIALVQNGIVQYKKQGKVADLEQFSCTKNTSGSIGIGHTRWATHGEPNDVNAHPHTSMHGKFTIIHNGIIENYSSLCRQLAERGAYKCASETDTEILANLIEYVYEKEHVSAEKAVRIALSQVEGAYGLLVLCADEPDKIIAARNGSPLVIGVGNGEYFLASDATPIVEYTNRIIYLNDKEIAVISKHELSLKTLFNDTLTPIIQELDLDIECIEKAGFDHFMQKEIFEQPKSITDTFRGRASKNPPEIYLGGLYNVMDKLDKADRIIVVACGTSWHAGLVGEYAIEELARIPVEVEYASEFRYRNPIIRANDVVIAISQSGETADTLAAVRLAKNAGATVIGVCNVVGSSITRETDAGVYTHAGPEIGVASTKAFTAQVTVLTMMALFLGKRRKELATERYEELITELYNVPALIEEILLDNEKYLHVARLYKDAPNSIYLGRGILFPVALEGALKMKEISYIHAEGYPAAEMKHGPIALIDENMPVIIIATKDKSYDKVVSNIQEVKARKGKVIAVVSKGDTVIAQLADHVFEVPECDSFIAPLTTVVPLQLLSYHVAVLRACNVDQPRNLAKSVTVE
ncbi:MAG: glutamine--fructose-6-phosphate transaminase (isomerizing) [Bacteroidales bacterium]|jgi:glucosamine--fructose-6-phosphate aminotransferase (isomerizing)|nr:glutamine--fructose-6-phosphate transaminase (isomerizing) [Bacteroidales bacterium]